MPTSTPVPTPTPAPTPVPPTPTNSCPVFDDDGPITTRSVDENTGSGTAFGKVVSATDDGDTLTYSLDRADESSFSIVDTTGQLRTRAALDYERKSSYTVTVFASDGRCTNSITVVTINVGDVDEPPLAPDAPTVTATSGSSTSLDVSWPTPANTGKPPITSYDLQYRQEGTTGNFQNGPQNVSDTSMAIPNLQPGILYQVRVRATNAEGDGPYSLPGLGRTNVPPPAPTDLRANGELVDGKVTLRWEPVSGEASYEVQYALDIFPAIGPLLWMTPDDDDISITDPTISREMVKEATLGSLTAGRLYQVRVRVTDTGAVSQWSDFVVVHPTAAPYTDGMDTEVATIGLFAYQPNGVFDYVICNPPAAYTDATSALIPVTFQTLPNQDYVGYIGTAVKDWDNFVKWDVGGGTNIIQTVDRGAITECRHPAIWVPETMPPPDQIIFVDDYDMGLLCQDSELLGCVRQPGPSAVEAQELPETIEAAPYFSILFTSQPESPSYPQSKWSDLGAKGCTRFHNVAVHEVGHAFGLHHQGNTDTSRRVIMTGYRYTPEGQHCDPTPYDVIAMMANYQSVPRSP